VHDVFGTIPRGRIVFPMDLFGIRDHSVDRVKIVAEAGWFENAAAEIISSSAISDYFDFNYVLNATPILGLAARNAGLRGSSPSAFGLQLLYWLRENGEGAEAFHLRNVVMRNWTGLGKYADGKGMGSMRSRQTIVERLVQGGYLEDDWACDRVEMTDQARQFLSILHKDCRDPDLPFRIRKWGALPAEEGHRKVDGYIKAFFGKQARTTDRSGMTRAAV
jgi:hypothetical protein